jgi:hypothetical protein
MSQALVVRNYDDLRKVLAAAAASGDLHQNADGSAGYMQGLNAAAINDQRSFATRRQIVVPKTANIVILDGGRVYWDRSASAAHFKKQTDRDFYLGRAVGDAASTDTTMTVNMNVDPLYDRDIAKDSFTTVIVGTEAVGGDNLFRRGGAHDIVINSTSEAQKVDMLGQDGWAAAGANAIVEFAFCVPSDGAGTVVDVSVGIASGTHASDADAIAQHLLMHLDANNTAIRFQSKDGTTTVTSTDSTKIYTEGQDSTKRVEVWFDMRNKADVQIYVDGVNVLGSTVFDVSAAASAWLLLCHVEKSAAADTYEFQLDWLRARFSEQRPG